MSVAEEQGAELGVLHDAYRLAAFESRRFTHQELWQVLGPLVDGARDLSRDEIGRSAEGRPLYAVRFGRGPVPVLLWSQMHGDESTHTMGLADLLAWLGRESDEPRVRLLHDRLRVVAIPMLNPDGAERFRRLNAQGMDPNRDAHAWLTPELRALRDVHAELRPAFALNLHDQDPRKRVGKSDRLTALALLANPFDEALGDNDVRLRAKRLGGVVARAVQPLIGGHVSRFQEEFNPQGSGEFMVSSGTSSLLLECGGWKDDPEKQFLRKVSFVALLSALEAVADGSYADVPLDEYESLDEDDTSVFDVLLRGGTIVVPGLEPYRADVGIEFPVPFCRENGEVASVGDLDSYTASEEVDVGGLFLHPHSEALRGEDGSRPVLGDGSPACFDVRAGPDAASERVMAVSHGVVAAADAGRVTRR
ncbi:MAG TPA: M14 family zinc carboxypeptidase [Longimicrobium sp.]|nr:M14 family zinc carboxypeptidase [Longimicrobium sp.]